MSANLEIPTNQKNILNAEIFFYFDDSISFKKCKFNLSNTHGNAVTKASNGDDISYAKSK